MWNFLISKLGIWPLAAASWPDIDGLTHWGLATPYGDLSKPLPQVMVWCPDGTKPLPEPKLTYHQWRPVTITGW